MILRIFESWLFSSVDYELESHHSCDSYGLAGLDLSKFFVFSLIIGLIFSLLFSFMLLPGPSNLQINENYINIAKIILFCLFLSVFLIIPVVPYFVNVFHKNLQIRYIELINFREIENLRLINIENVNGSYNFKVLPIPVVEEENTIRSYLLYLGKDGIRLFYNKPIVISINGQKQELIFLSKWKFISFWFPRLILNFKIE